MPTLAPHSGSGSFPSPAGFPAFFRDEGELKALKTLMRRRLDAPAGAPLRVWVPECSTGEDAYTVAMSLLEAAGRRWREMPLAVLSTGSDRDALALARAGRYSAAHPGLSDARRRRFFETRDGALRARPFLRASCLFVPRHPSEGPPGGRFDLIASRDVLRGFAPERRHPLLAEYHAALAPRGLLLDRSGCAADVPGLFAPVGRGRSYAAVARPRAAPPPSGEGEERFRVLFSQSAEAILVRDAATDRVLEANVAAQALLGYGLPELIQMTGEELTVPPGVVRRALNERRGEARLRMPHYRRADGTVFSADVRTSFLMSGGRPCRLDMIRDASERLRAAGAEGATRAATPSWARSSTSCALPSR
ncbi:MAG: PAS domain S-box protein [Elusimicrobiota bacterium]|nr:MAG: PAS domain S-box protein [Elusimicrobiota bacterium]